jgi:hypothetical protein
MSGLRTVQGNLAALNVVEVRRQSIGTDSSALGVEKGAAWKPVVGARKPKALQGREKEISGNDCEFGDLVACLQCRCQTARRIQGCYGCNRHSAGAFRRISCGAFDLVPSCQRIFTVLRFTIGLTLQTTRLSTKLGL